MSVIAMQRVEVKAAQFLAEQLLQFVKGDCYFPTDIKVDEEFIMKFLISHQGPACLFWFGFRYKGLDYIFTDINGIPLEENQGIRIEFLPATMRKFLEKPGLEEFDTTKTIEITFLCGFIEADTHYWTDSLTYNCYVEVPTEAWYQKIPWWGWAGGGVGVILTGVVITKPWK